MYMKFYYHGLLRRFDFLRECASQRLLSQVDKLYVNCLDAKVNHHRCDLGLEDKIPEKPMTALISISFSIG